jgi:hypothetical protein
MSINELMIDDWVYIKDYPMRKEAKKVTPQHFVRSLVEFEPIPLTTEILLKNGFEDLGCGEYYFADENGNRVLLDTRGGEEYMTTNDSWFAQAHNNEFDVIGSIELTYVHELQHFFKSCKLNIVIVL